MTFWEKTDAEKPSGDSAPPAPTKRERPGGWLALVVVLVLALLVGGGYVAAYFAAGDKVPRGTSVSGVEVGGLTRAAAIAELEEAFADRDDAPITVAVEAPKGAAGADAAGAERSAEVRPDEIGLAVDAEASVDAAGAGRSWSPGRQWDYFTGGDDVDAVVDIDEDLLGEQLDVLSRGLGRQPKDGAIRFTGGGVRTIDPVVGEAVDPDAAREAIVAAYLGEKDSATLTVGPAQPEIDDKDVQEALDSFANPAMAAPVTLVFGKSEVTLRPRDYAGVLSMVAENGELVPKVDEKLLTRLVGDVTTDGEPVDATVRLVDGKPKVIPAKPGVSFEPADVTEVFTGLLTAKGKARTGEVKAKVKDAAFTTQDAKDLGIKELVSEGVTHFPHADYRNTNIGRAAELIDGTILKPGDVFSLNGIVGERTVENGFTTGYVISDGILKQDLGGGVSQMATTTFNAMFFAGLKDVEHKPHSFYIDRYPEGREATVAWPSVDLRFENDTDYGVLIHAWVEPSNYSRQGTVTVQMFSTKVWDIESVTSDRYGYVSPGTRTLTTPDCEPNTGWSGFQVDVTRIFRKHGEDTVDHRETFHTDYIAADSVVCKEPPPPPKNGGNGGDGGD